MDFQSKLARVRRQYDTMKFQFVNVELDLAITYCEIAADAKDWVKSYRNIVNAERAYSAAAYFLGGNLSAPQNRQIKEKLIRFRSLRANFDSIL